MILLGLIYKLVRQVGDMK